MNTDTDIYLFYCSDFLSPQSKDGSQWIVLGKGCALIALSSSALRHAVVGPSSIPQGLNLTPLESSGLDSIPSKECGPESTLPPHLLIDGVHTMPISGQQELIS